MHNKLMRGDDGDGGALMSGGLETHREVAERTLTETIRIVGFQISRSNRRESGSFRFRLAAGMTDQLKGHIPFLFSVQRTKREE